MGKQKQLLANHKKIRVVWLLNLVPFFYLGNFYAGGASVAPFIWIVWVITFINSGHILRMFLLYVLMSVIGSAMILASRRQRNDNSYLERNVELARFIHGEPVSSSSSLASELIESKQAKPSDAEGFALSTMERKAREAEEILRARTKESEVLNFAPEVSKTADPIVQQSARPAAPANPLAWSADEGVGSPESQLEIDRFQRAGGDMKFAENAGNAPDAVDTASTASEVSASSGYEPYQFTSQLNQPDSAPSFDLPKFDNAFNFELPKYGQNTLSEGATSKCPKCGADMNTNFSFCLSCGYSS